MQTTRYAQGSVKCTCDQSTVNPLHLRIGTDEFMNKTIVIQPNPNFLKLNAFVC